MRQPQDSIENSVMTGLVKGSRRRDRLKIRWFDNKIADSQGRDRDRGCWKALTHLGLVSVMDCIHRGGSREGSLGSDEPPPSETEML